jgi:hypothetical protein
MRGLATILAAACYAATSAGCAATCGLIAQPGFMTDGGYVAFSAPVGASQTVNVPLVDSNATANETVTGSKLTGTDAAAFKVLSTFPMSLTAGNAISVSVEFTPQHGGTSTASLVLDTATMGPSPISLEGTAY